MVSKTTKTITLILSIGIMITSFLPIDFYIVGISKNCSLEQRLVYHFFHVGFFHALTNSIALLSISFSRKLYCWQLIAAYAIAITIPQLCLYDKPTVGLSAIIYALFGIISLSSRRKVIYNIFVVVCISIGFLFPYSNALIHLYCYIGGFVVSVLTTPIKI